MLLQASAYCDSPRRLVLCTWGSSSDVLCVHAHMAHRICRHCRHSAQHAALAGQCSSRVQVWCVRSAPMGTMVCNTSACVLARSCSAKLYLCSAAAVDLLSCIARMHVFRPGVLRDSPAVGVQLALGPCCWLAFCAGAAVGCSLVVQLSAAEASAMQRLAPVCARRARVLSCSGCCAVHCIISSGVLMAVLFVITSLACAAVWCCRHAGNACVAG